MKRFGKGNTQNPQPTKISEIRATKTDMSMKYINNREKAESSPSHTELCDIREEFI